MNICIYLNKNRCGFALKLLNLKLQGTLLAWGPSKALCIGKAQADFTESCVFVKMEVNHFNCTLLKLFFVSMLACLLHYVDVFETFRKYGQLEEGMTTHSGIPTWEIPWTEEPGSLQSIGWQRVRHNLADNMNTFTLRMDSLAPSHSLGNHLILHCFVKIKIVVSDQKKKSTISVIFLKVTSKIYPLEANHNYYRHAVIYLKINEQALA